MKTIVVCELMRCWSYRAWRVRMWINVPLEKVNETNDEANLLIQRLNKNKKLFTDLDLDGDKIFEAIFEQTDYLSAYEIVDKHGNGEVVYTDWP